MYVTDKDAVVCPFCNEEVAAYYNIEDEVDELTNKELHDIADSGYEIFDCEPDGYMNSCEHTAITFTPEGGDTEILDEEFANDLKTLFPDDSFDDAVENLLYGDGETVSKITKKFKQYEIETGAACIDRMVMRYVFVNNKDEK